LADITAYLFGLAAIILFILYWMWTRRKVEKFEQSYRVDEYPEDNE